jgi:type II secretory pathway component PulF
MLGSPRISLKALAALCRRLAMASSAGLDVRNIWRREAEHASGRLKATAQHVYEVTAGGGGVGDALREDSFLPPVVRRLVAVGEQTGSSAEVYRRLADHYERQVEIRRAFLASLAWPLIQLFASVCIIGCLIWFTGFIAGRNPGQKAVDPLGLGLMGTRGLVIYLTVVGAATAAVGVVIVSMHRGAAWTLPIRHAAERLPVVGGALQKIGLSRFAWTLQLACNTAMDVQQAVRLALESTGLWHFARHADAACADLAAGREIHEALRRTSAFPNEFVDAVNVAEHSGQLVESLERLSHQYEQQAQTAASVLSRVASFLIWAIIAAAITAAIFRLAGFYFGTIRSFTGTL